MRLSDHLVPGAVFLSAGSSRDELLSLLVDGICRQWGEGDVPTLMELVWERERQGSTAVGLGVAIPHLRCGSLTDLRIAAAVQPLGTDFPSPDGMPVRLVFLLASPPDKAGFHLRALAQVARLDREAVDRLVASKDQDEFLFLLRRAEERPGGRP